MSARTALADTATDALARLLLRCADTVTARSRVPNPFAAVGAVQELLATTGGGDFYEAVQERLVALGFPPSKGCGRCASGPCACTQFLAGLLEALGPLGVHGAVRSAVELYGASGDPHDLLSGTQVDQLCAAAEHFAEDDES
ncbi:hypothetical protein QMK19_39075 [Streptomyces sp. H10-C2]|uniref:hypothetical protein n=1 Tax=unclassified Streptomyces TaxID=2593676 RepID=UPI0024BA10F3|nr:MULTISPECIES: hypothetical protein [unclassified Streptomyces]MDJ0347213.1 hypothetical protein [Streptomyces sp. PH10-H1]MDJ0375439.1 hypothetical protein [Streptomyces sp. H10-C2]